MAKYQRIEQPSVEKFKELSQCLDRLKSNPDWIMFVENYLFKDFLEFNVQNIKDPDSQDEAIWVKQAMKAIHFVNWFKSFINYTYDNAEEQPLTKE